jgi:glycosyltransferase involved in cell wall biosynthesis
MPTENLAAKIVSGQGAGTVVKPGDIEGFVQTAQAFHAKQAELQTMGTNARAYAEATFSIETITDRFEEIFKKVTSVK